MHVRAKITGLTSEQWATLQEIVQTSYEGASVITMVDTTFELHCQEERRVSMPLAIFGAVVSRIAHDEIVRARHEAAETEDPPTRPATYNGLPSGT